MTNDEVRGTLRHAVKTGTIVGWYRHAPFRGLEWVINPSVGRCRSYTADGIRDWCGMYRSAAGIHAV